MEGWNTHKFSDVVFIQEGPGIRKYEYANDGYPMINVRCVKNGFIDMSKSKNANSDLANGKWKHFQIEAGDILFTISGTIGRSAIVKQSDLPLLMNTSVVRFRPLIEGLSVRFLYWWVNTTQFISELKGYSTGTAIKNVGPTHIKKLFLSFPPLPEQERIVAMLDEAFAAIDTATANTEKNLANAKELFESFLDDQLTSTARDWSSSTIEQLCHIGDGNHSSKYPKKSEMVTSGVPFIRGVNLLGGSISSDDMRYITVAKHATLKKGHLKADDILFTNRGEIGKVAIVDKRFDGANLNSQIAWLRSKGDVLPEYLFFFLQSRAMKQCYSKAKTGAALQQFTIRMLKAVQIKYPPFSEQKNIISIIQRAIADCDAVYALAESKQTHIFNLKQSLLQKAFTGELTADPKVVDRTLSEASV